MRFLALSFLLVASSAVLALDEVLLTLRESGGGELPSSANLGSFAKSRVGGRQGQIHGDCEAMNVATTSTGEHRYTDWIDQQRSEVVNLITC